MASRKVNVSATSRMVRAISFGVFWRVAPSTMPIMRSRKVSPGLTLMRTTSQSDSTRVPPVTALKSPPDSRMTGADSPVMADSSTEATPSITSPSPGMVSPASTSTTSPRRRSSAGSLFHGLPYPGSSCFLANTVFFRPLSAAACALPRPSAIASAKLANSTVNHSQRVMARMKPGVSTPCGSPWPTSAWRKSPLVRRLPSQTTNITGFFSW